MSTTTRQVGRESRLHTALRWIAIGATVAVVVSVVIFVSGATSGFAYVLGIAVAWLAGFFAIKAQLNQLAAQRPQATTPVPARASSTRAR